MPGDIRTTHLCPHCAATWGHHLQVAKACLLGLPTLLCHGPSTLMWSWAEEGAPLAPLVPSGPQDRVTTDSPHRKGVGEPVSAPQPARNRHQPAASPLSSKGPSSKPPPFSPQKMVPLLCSFNALACSSLLAIPCCSRVHPFSSGQITVLFSKSTSPAG